MPIIKEVREFFLRHTKVLTGVKRDREQPYPLQYITTNALGELVIAYNRFLAGDIPSDDTFKKFLESITFKLNAEDTATETEQGLVSIATNSECIAGTQTDANSYQLAVSPRDYKVLYDLVSDLTNGALKIRFYTSMPTTLLQGEKLGDLGVLTNPTNAACGTIYELTDVTPGAAVWTVKYDSNMIPSGGNAGDMLVKPTPLPIGNNFASQWAAPFLPVGTKIYLGRLFQTGTSAPDDAGIQCNTIGAINWTYSGLTGTYYGDLVGAFPESKTTIFALTNPLNNPIISAGRVSDDRIVIYSADTSFSAANGMNIFLLIIVLP